MAWYTTECLYRADIGDGSREDKPLFEYRYFLLKAENDLSADQKAHEIAKRKQHQYSNVEGKRVTWVLERVTGTKEVFAKELSEETEIYYKYVDQPFPE